jgi:peptidoglycan/LPS O-acetylase OafA/YrhL
MHPPPPASRDNNFNLLRVIAALLVLVTHSYGVTGFGDDEPMMKVFGVSLGTFAVDVFFVTSGYLIAKSWDRRRSPAEFLWSRFLRIYPALWVCVAFCVFVVGLYFTTLPAIEFLTHFSVLKFVLEDTTLIIKGVYTTLPGVFATTDGEGSVNVPLWTLPYELKMYLGLLALGWTGLLYRRLVPPLLALAAYAIYVWTLRTDYEGHGIEIYSRFIFFFAAGTTLYLERNLVPLKWSIALPLVALIGASVALPDKDWRSVVLDLCMPYLVIFLALVPSGFFRAYNKVGDYSYGLYIYGFPVQQSLVALAGGSQSVGANLIWTIVVAGALAALSWHFLEKHALALKWRPWRTAPVLRPAGP